MATKTTRNLIVGGFTRKYNKEYQLDIPDDIITVIMMFYPQWIEFEGNTVELTEEEKEIITGWFIDVLELENNSCILSSKLLYDYDKHGTEGDDYYEHCLKGKNTFSIVRTNHNGHIFGCFLSKPINDVVNTDKSTVSDDKAFLCVIRSSFKDKQPTLFKVKQEEKYTTRIYKTYSWIGPCFGWSFDLQILKWDYCNHSNTCFQGEIKGNILCGGKMFDETNESHKFNVVNMTTFEINID